MLPSTTLTAPSSGSFQAESLVAEQVDAGVHSGRIVTCSFPRLGQGHVETKRLASGGDAPSSPPRCRRDQSAIPPLGESHITVADKAMHLAKTNGRDRIEDFLTPEAGGPELAPATAVLA